MQILITGGRGFIGSHLVKHLLTLPEVENILVLDNHSNQQPVFHTDDKLKYVYGNACDLHNIATITDFVATHVFHLGEQSRIFTSLAQPEAVLQSNLMGTIQVLKYCVKTKAKLIYTGSSAIFKPEGQGFDFDHATPYTWGKKSMVELIQFYQEWYGLNYVIAYIYNCYGPGQIKDGPYQTVIGVFERQYAEGQPLSIVLPGTQERKYTHVSDIVKGLVMCGQFGQGDNYHLYNPKVYTLLDLANLFGCDYQFIPARVGDRKQVPNLPSRAIDELGWKCEHELGDYVAELKPIDCHITHRINKIHRERTS